MKRFLAVASAVAMLAGTAQAADSARDFAPSTPWAADFGEDYCRLTRDFSDGKSTVSIIMDRIQPGNSLRFMAVGDTIKTYRGADQFGYRFTPGGDERSAMVVRGNFEVGQYLNFGDIILGPPLSFPEPGEAPTLPGPYSREEEKAFAAGVTGIALSRGLTSPVNIETGALDAPIEVLQTCIDDLLTYWGLDAEKHRHLTSPAFPTSDTSKWLPTNTIGFADFAKLGASNNQLRVMIDAQGKATSCHVHWQSLDETTNKKICAALTETGTYSPAIDAVGNAIASYWVVSPFFLMSFGGT